MAYIKSVSELPKWFNLKNYQQEKEEITATNFLTQIMVRKTLYDLVACEDFEYPVAIEATYRDSCIFGKLIDLDVSEIRILTNRSIDSELTAISYKNHSVLYAFSKICSDPLLKTEWSDTLKSHEFAWHFCIKTVVNEYLNNALIKPIKDVEIWEIGEKFAMLPNMVNEYLESEFNEFYKDEYLDELSDKELEEYRQLEPCSSLDELTSEDYEELEEFCRQSFTEYESKLFDEHPYDIKPLISVDLSCPDHLLKEQFEKWLTTQRDKANKIIQEENLDSDFYIKNSGESLLQKVYLYQILAYIDLEIWALITGNKIKQSVCSHALYPTGGYDGEFIRKTLRPLVMKLFNPKSKEIAELFALKNMEEFSI